MSAITSPIDTPTPGSFSDNWEVFEAAVRAFHRGDYEGGCRLAAELHTHISTRDPKSRQWLLQPIEELLLVESVRYARRGHAA